VGNIDAETFTNLVAELFALLAEPDCQGVLALADHLGGADWWDEHRLGYGVVTTVASLQHWASRLKVVASVAKCLLGKRSLWFFRFCGLRCVGQRDLYPFGILFRELHQLWRAFDRDLRHGRLKHLEYRYRPPTEVNGDFCHQYCSVLCILR
jgi:hypothetical protein